MKYNYFLYLTIIFLIIAILSIAYWAGGWILIFWMIVGFPITCFVMYFGCKLTEGSGKDERHY